MSETPHTEKLYVAQPLITHLVFGFSSCTVKGFDACKGFGLRTFLPKAYKKQVKIPYYIIIKLNLNRTSFNPQPQYISVTVFAHLPIAYSMMFTL